jgi:hypothetical protein
MPTFSLSVSASPAGSETRRLLPVMIISPLHSLLPILKGQVYIQYIRVDPILTYSKDDGDDDNDDDFDDDDDGETSEPGRLAIA